MIDQPPTADVELEAGSFHQEPPVLGNQYREDPLLESLLRRLLGEDRMRAVEPELIDLGERAVTDLAELAEKAEEDPPRHVPYDPWGRRIDRIETSPAWERLRRFSAERGLVATAYERAWGDRSRIVQHALLYLFGPSSATYLCPLAMTDGAARLLETTTEAEEIRDRALPRLITRDPGKFWVSGQWMTERAGGSDVGRSETRARRRDAEWSLHGSKWFTSAVDSDMAFTLARPEGAPSGSRGLALFYVELRDERGRLQGIRIDRLKDKLGTRALPTAELTLDGAPARRIGEVGEGVGRITALMNVTRIYNANAAAGGMRRALALASDYARRRRAFGRTLIEHPLHRRTLEILEAETALALVLVFRAAELQGRVETGTAGSAEEAALRLLTPLVKLFTGKQAVRIASEALECFGGAGYVEDTGLPRLLRDAQVLPIWEGTTNVLSLDALRAIERQDALEPFLVEIDERLASIEDAGLRDRASALRGDLGGLERDVGRVREEGPKRARRLAFRLTRALGISLLLEQAQWSRREEHESADRWSRALELFGATLGGRAAEPGIA